jgi:thiamine pyrophosphate-dependent acetolactate synthase large subunit-like protein
MTNKPVLGWGSDALAAILRDMGVKYIALTPGSSYRGLHESLVNYLGNRDPEMLLCLHEEHAVALAHGYSKVTGTAIAALVHANVGMMHASMAVYDAFCDRAPILVIGGVGALDATRRAKPAHWYHGALDQGGLVRDFVKWDDQPTSIPAAIDSLLRAYQIARTPPFGPVCVNLDQKMQEDSFPGLKPWPDAKRFGVAPPMQPHPDTVRQAAEKLVAAKNPVILAGRVSRDLGAWNDRVKLAETLGADVLTGLRIGAAFPTDHPLHAADPDLDFPDKRGWDILRQADVVLALDWIDMAGLFKEAWKGVRAPVTIIRASADRLIHKGWSRDHMAVAPADIDMLAEPDSVVPILLTEIARLGGCPAGQVRLKARAAESRPKTPVRADHGGPDAIGLWDIGTSLTEIHAKRDVCLIRLPVGWHAGSYAFRHPLDYLGFDGAGGVGSGPGMAVGAALALKGTDRLPIAVIGDGDYLMGATALWTASHHRIPLLLIVANNDGYNVDEEHQRMVSRQRNRTIDNAWIGQRLCDPGVDLLPIARAQGFDGEGPIETRTEFSAALARGVAAVASGGRYFLDVRVVPDREGVVG